MDSLSGASEQLRSYLLETLPKTTGSLTENIQAPESMWVVTSPDKKLREWAWDTKTGGSMPEIIMLLEYQTPHGLAVTDPHDTTQEGNTPDWFDTIYTVHSKSGHTYYLPIISSQYSTKDVGSRIEAYEIVGDKLNTTVNLFRTPKKELHSIAINYDYFSNYSDALSRERFRIKLSPDAQILTIPVVVGDSVTAGTLKYIFDGERYVFKETVK
ncbi:MAG TPA: hypothetical protein VET48_14125 [Steroidobacteraceae bacterium]|nr:hypothetical protein [Steroidobacteraceae bacterium]